MTKPWQALEWDSAFFGMPVARLNPGVRADELTEALSGLRAAGFGLAYWILESPDEARAHAALTCGGQHVDEKTTWLASAAQVLAATGSVTAAVTETDGPADALLPLAVAAGAWSRFRVDPRIGAQQFERLYGTWLERSLRHELADAVFITGTRAAPTGFVTVGRKNDRADIGLIAVAEQARGRGCGKALVLRAAAWARDAGHEAIQVVTQGANREACALYERCGFAQETVNPVFHFWLQPEQRP